MSSSWAKISTSTTLLFLILAVVIFLRLRNVLGRRTGNERQPYDPYTAHRTPVHAPEKPGGQDTVVPLPNARDDASGLRSLSRRIAERVEKFAPKGSPLEKGLTDIAKVDAEFDPEHFLSGAKAAYEMIVMAFAGGNRRTLRQLARQGCV